MRKLLLILLMLLLPIICLSCVFSKDNEHKDWNTYTDERFKFSIQYPKNWVAEFWKGKTEPDPYFGRLADYSNGLIIEFAFYKLDNGENLDTFVKHTVNKHDKFYFKETKMINNVPVIRYGVHLYLEDGESYVLRQFINVEKENVLDLMSDLPQKSMEKKDDKYKLILEIMDTFKKL